MYDGKLFFQNLAFILLTASEKTRMDAHPFHYIFINIYRTANMEMFQMVKPINRFNNYFLAIA